MEVGLRVVRGPDWKWQDQDGGEGHVGTVIAIGTGENNIPSQTAVVQWDSGFLANYRVGFQGAYDLRVLDSRPIGVKHLKKVCSACTKRDIPGCVWWELSNGTLCQQCYMTDQQDLGNSLLRYDHHYGPGVRVPVRSTSRKVESLGIFPGTTVVRGRDWKWGNQDGGDGQQGTVVTLEDCGRDCESRHSVVTVRWASGTTNIYRLGHLGKVDLKCVQETSGGSYYPEHLPVLGLGAVSCDSGHTVYTPGDHVKVCVDIDTVKKMQDAHGGWTLAMEQYIDKVGRVLRVTENGGVCVQYTGCSDSWTFNAQALAKVEGELATRTTPRLEREEDATADKTPTFPNPRRSRGGTPATTLTERLDAVVTSYLNGGQSAVSGTDRSSLATTTGSDESEVTGMTSAGMSRGQTHNSGMTAVKLESDVKWIPKSKRYKTLLTKLRKLKENDLVSLSQLHINSEDPTYKIGTGNFGVVFLGFIQSDWREVAIKRIQNIHQDNTTNELDILIQLQDHQNIVSYRMCDKDKDFTYIATELCDHTLDEWLKEVDLHPPGEWGPTASGLTRDLLGGLAYLHSRNPKVLHRDVKPANMFVVRTTEWHLKLADFGISRTLEEGASTICTRPAGTRYWKAREVLMCDHVEPVRYKASTDIQPAGMVAFCIMTKDKHPYAPNGRNYEIESNLANDKPDLSAVTDLVACDMLTSMLAADPTKRPSAAQLLQHPFFWSEDKRYQFLAAVGNQAEVANSHVAEHANCHVRNFLEAAKCDITPQGDWTAAAEKLDKLNKRFQKNFKQSDFTESICKLLRTLRNIQDHFDEQSGDAKADLGNTCYPYRFFDTQLPLLFIRTYSIVSETAGTPDDWTVRHQLKGYFSDLT